MSVGLNWYMTHYATRWPVSTVWGQSRVRRYVSTTQWIRQRPKCGIGGNGFIEIQRALNGPALSLPRSAAIDVTSQSSLQSQKCEAKAMKLNGTVTTGCMVQVTFKVPYRVELGDYIAICGDVPDLGNWRISRALQLNWTPGHIWSMQTHLPPGTYEYKCVHVRADGTVGSWEAGRNRMIHVPESSSDHSEMDVSLEFGQTGVSHVMMILRETIVMSPSGDELFRVMTGQGRKKLQNFFKATEAEIDTIPAKEIVHDVRSYPLDQEYETVRHYLIAELRLEDDEVDLLHRRIPSLRFRSVEQELRPWVNSLKEDVGMSHTHVARLFMKRPSIIDVSVTDVLKPLTLYFVKNLHTDSDRFFSLLIRRPSLIRRSLETEIKPRVRLLKQLTRLDDRGVGKVLVGCSDLLWKTEAEIRRRIDNLKRQLGLSIVQCTQLFERSPSIMQMRSETMTRKIVYFTKTLKRSTTEIVAYPHCLTYSLEKRVTKRFHYLDHIGFVHSACRLPAILKPPDRDFYRKYKPQSATTTAVEPIAETR